MCSAPVPPREVEAPVLAPCPAVRTYIPRGAAPPRLRAPASSHPLQGKSPAPSSLWPAGSRSPIGAHLSPWALPRCARRARRSATAPWRRTAPAPPTHPALRAGTASGPAPATRAPRRVLPCSLSRPMQGPQLPLPVVSGHPSYRCGAKLPEGSICRGAKTNWQEGFSPGRTALLLSVSRDITCSPTVQGLLFSVGRKQLKFWRSK